LYAISISPTRTFFAGISYTFIKLVKVEVDWSSAP
jgi:hypothetical protein